MARVALDVRVVSRGGGRTYIQNLVPALLALDQKNEYLLIRVPGDGMIFPSGLRTIRPPLSNPVAQLAWVQIILPRLLEREHVDIYHSLKHLGPLRLRAIKVYTQGAIGHFHGNYPLPWNENLYWKTFGRMFLRSVDQVIAVSRFVADGIPKDLGITQRQIRVIPHGLDPIFSTANAKSSPVGSKPMHILAVGNLYPVKNFSTLIRAYAQLDSDLRQSYPLVIAGSTADAEFGRLRALSGREGVSDRVRFAGEVNKNALIHLYRRSILFVMPSLHESFGFALLEAMASGVCCICAACGGAEEIGGKDVLLVQDPLDFQGFASAMNELLRNKKQREKLAKNARKQALRYTWEHTARETLDLYEELLSTRRS